MRSVISMIQWMNSKRSHDQAVEAVHNPVSGKRDEFYRAFLTRLEPHRRSRRDVEPEAARRCAIEGERRVDFEEMKMRADLHWPVAGIRHHHLHRFATRVEFEFAVVDQVFAGDHARLLRAVEDRFMESDDGRSRAWCRR